MYRNVGVNVSEELIDCVDKGDFVSAKKLIDAGADINFQHSVNGYTALMLASRMDDINFVKYLLSKGAKINIKDKYDGNVLNYACLTGQTKIVELLIEKGANINQSKYNAPLSVAARNGHFNIVQILINKGAKIDSKNINDQTALMQACDGGGNYGKNKVVKNPGVFRAVFRQP